MCRKRRHADDEGERACTEHRKISEHGGLPLVGVGTHRCFHGMFEPSHLSARESSRPDEKDSRFFRRLGRGEPDRLPVNAFGMRRDRLLFRRQAQRLDQRTQVEFFAPWSMNSTTSSSVLKAPSCMYGAVSVILRRVGVLKAPLSSPPWSQRSGQDPPSSAPLGAHRVVKLVIREARPVVAKDAAGFPSEKCQTSNGNFIHGLLIARHILIESGIRREHRAFVGGNRLGNTL